ncbi:ALP1-like protein [Tanacetum coccineum]
MNNDVNVLRQSPLFNDLKVGKASDVPFVANKVPYKKGYYLTNGIYSQWSVLIKSIKNPGMNDHKRILYKTKHEASRKDVERAFGALKKKWKLIKHPAREMSRRRLSDVMYTCIILHNIIIHDNKVVISSKFFREEQQRDDDPLTTSASWRGNLARFAAMADVPFFLHATKMRGQTKDGNFVEGIDETMVRKSHQVLVEEGDGVLDSEGDGVDQVAVIKKCKVDEVDDLTNRFSKLESSQTFVLIERLLQNNDTTYHTDVNPESSIMSTDPMVSIKLCYLKLFKRSDGDHMEIDSENGKDDILILSMHCTF